MKKHLRKVYETPGSAPGLGHSEADRNSEKKWGGKCLQCIMVVTPLQAIATNMEIREKVHLFTRTQLYRGPIELAAACGLYLS